MRTSDIIMSQSDNNITLDFSAFSSMEENDYFELNVNNISIKLNVNANMSTNDFTEWLASNCNNNYDFYSIATASNNNNVLSITSKTSDALNIDYDFNR
jgi:hypothetical protein